MRRGGGAVTESGMARTDYTARSRLRHLGTLRRRPLHAIGPAAQVQCRPPCQIRLVAREGARLGLGRSLLCSSRSVPRPLLPSGCSSSIPTVAISRRTTRSRRSFARTSRDAPASLSRSSRPTSNSGAAPSEKEERALLDYLRVRFDDAPPDVVVTIGPPAARLYVRHRAELFPGTPLVMGALDQRFVQQMTLAPTDAVVAGKLDLPGLVENILQLLPETQTIAVVVGASELERFLAWRAETRISAVHEPRQVRVAQ